MVNTDTIAAIATPPGTGALGIIRISGNKALSIAQKIFIHPGKNKDHKSRTLLHGEILKNNDVIDEVMMAVMRAPNSYTGEDTIEFTCHGNNLIIVKILELCIENGARLAEPGEFTKRRFLSGKIDLSQAESVNRLINAHSENAAKEAIKNIKGNIRENVEKIKESIVQIKMNVDADIEWGDTEEIHTMEVPEIARGISNTENDIKEMLDHSINAKKLMKGIRIVICGKPNAGKSSLFNAILKSSRSITSRVPGTTRDVIESEAVVEGNIINLIDTAGIGLKSKTSIDKIAIKKSREEIEKADLIIYVIDGKSGIERTDHTIKRRFADKEWIPVINKCDIKIALDEDKLKKFCGKRACHPISCKNNTGLYAINNEIKKLLKKNESHKMMITLRQRKALQNAKKAIVNTKEIMEQKFYPELISYELQVALNNLGKIDGTIIQEDMMEKIFNEFCIGK
jgi:tRNA modification GTPase